MESGRLQTGGWLGCFYDGAVIRLSKRLDDNLNECRVIYSPAVRVSENAKQIVAVECK